MVTPWRLIKGAEPDALKGASPVLNGGDEETGLVRPRLVATQLECAQLNQATTIISTVLMALQNDPENPDNLA